MWQRNAALLLGIAAVTRAENGTPDPEIWGFLRLEFPEDEAEGQCWAQAMFSVQRKEGRTAQLRHEKRQMLQAKHQLNYHL